MGVLLACTEHSALVNLLSTELTGDLKDTLCVICKYALFQYVVFKVFSTQGFVQISKK